MKRIFAFIMTLAMVASFVSGCNKEPKKKALDVTGIWELVDVTPVTKAAQIGDQTVEVFIEFLSDGNFTMYQKMGAGAYKSYSGTWTLTGDVLDGVYSDKKAWGSKYTVTREGDALTLANEGEIYTYNKTGSLPASRL